MKPTVVTVLLGEEAFSSVEARRAAMAMLATKKSPLLRTPHTINFKTSKGLPSRSVLIQADIYGFGPAKSADLAWSVENFIAGILTEEANTASRLAAIAIDKAKTAGNQGIK